jgi:integrase
MSVYKRHGSPYYRYDFEFKGTRFSGSTECTNKRDAEAFEQQKRKELKREFDNSRRLEGAPMTLDQALGRYWDEVGQHAKSHRQVEWSSHYLIKHLGADKPLRDITDSDVSALVARRRGDTVVNLNHQKSARKNKPPPKRVSVATVNRSVIEPLKRVMRRAEESWGETVGKIKWKEHRMKEPGERVRSASDDEEGAIFAKLPAHYHPVILFAIKSGCRASEICGLNWNDIDWKAKRVTIRGKGGKVAQIPLTAAMVKVLKPLKPDNAIGRVPVFRNMGGEPLTYRALSAAFRTACEKAGVKNLRLHDLRHTAATRLLRETGNLRMVQRLLRHSDVSTSAKYAHTADDELLAAMDAMDAVETQEVPPKAPSADAK